MSPQVLLQGIAVGVGLVIVTGQAIASRGAGWWRDHWLGVTVRAGLSLILVGTSLAMALAGIAASPQAGAPPPIASGSWS